MAENLDPGQADFDADSTQLEAPPTDRVVDDEPVLVDAVLEELSGEEFPEDTVESTSARFHQFMRVG